MMLTHHIQLYRTSCGIAGWICSQQAQHITSHFCSPARNGRHPTVICFNLLQIKIPKTCHCVFIFPYTYSSITIYYTMILNGVTHSLLRDTYLVVAYWPHLASGECIKESEQVNAHYWDWTTWWEREITNHKVNACINVCMSTRLGWSVVNAVGGQIPGPWGIGLLTTEGGTIGTYHGCAGKLLGSRRSNHMWFIHWGNTSRVFKYQGYQNQAFSSL